MSLEGRGIAPTYSNKPARMWVKGQRILPDSSHEGAGIDITVTRADYTTMH